MTRSNLMESLESRQLMAAAPTVTSLLADNRGEVTLTFSRAVNNISSNTVKVFLAGPDGVIGTVDDVRKTDIGIKYFQASNRLTINAYSDINQIYRVRLEDDIVSTNDARKLDGEFTGTSTGNGKPGGDFNFSTRRDRSVAPTVRMYTSAGSINVRLLGTATGIERTIQNFNDYVNAGRYDGTIFHRKITVADGGIGITQAGGFTGTGETNNGSFVEPSQTIPAYGPIPLESGVLSNLAGTIAMARTSDPNSATSQFFFNNTDNTVLDKSSSSDGYAVFGQITNSAGFDTIGRVYDAPNVSVGQSGVFSTLPQIDGNNITIRRVATIMKIDAVA